MIYNIYFDILAVAISFFSIILAFTKKDFWKRQNFMLLISLVATFLASVLDILSSVGNSYLVEWSYGLRDLLNYGYLAVQNIMPYLFCLYIVFLVDLDHQLSSGRWSRFRICLCLPYALDVVLLCLNPFIREVFYYDADRVYTHDWGMNLIYVIAFLYMIYNYFLIIRYGKKVRFVKKATVYLFLTASLVSVVFQIIIPTVLLQLCVEALCLSGILFTVENENKILHSILLYFFLLMMNIFAQVEIIPNQFPWRMISSIYFLTLSVLLVQYFAERIVDRGKMKRWMLASTSLMVLFMFLRVVKYEAFADDYFLCRYMWYLYYLPVLCIPLCTFYATLWIGGGEEGRFTKVKWGSAAITFLLLFFVLTNDLHQKVFCFREGFVNWDSDYTYAWGYFAVMVWSGILNLAAIVTMITKSRLSGVKKKWGITMIPFALGIIMLLLIVSDKMPKINGLMVINFPEAMCFMIALFWECCIQIGLIPTNKGYGELMRVSSLAMQITDKSGNVVYRSLSAREPDEVHLKKTGLVLLDENTELYCEEIPGGYTYWQNDISELNEVNRQLEEVRSLLVEETELIRLENELKEKQASIKLYEQINERTITQSGKITALAEATLQSKDTGVRNYNAGIICFLGAYIKRYSNLKLLSENEDWLRTAELGMAIAEPLRYLANVGIPTDYLGSGNGKIEAENAILLYEILEELIEQNLTSLQAVYVRLEQVEKMTLKITMEGVRATLGTDAMKKLGHAGFDANITYEDGISYIGFRRAEGA